MINVDGDTYSTEAEIQVQLRNNNEHTHTLSKIWMMETQSKHTKNDEEDEWEVILLRGMNDVVPFSFHRPTDK